MVVSDQKKQTDQKEEEKKKLDKNEEEKKGD
jgi:hypothetical protein